MDFMTVDVTLPSITKDIENSSNEKSYNENQLFTSFICPIYIKSTHDSSLIWYNQSPSSPLYCRLLKILYKSETDDTVKTRIQSNKARNKNFTKKNKNTK